jgi:hypothetical protein
MTSRSKLGLIILAVLSVAVAARAWWTSRSQPQLPASDEVFKTVDSLFTAVTARDSQHLAACEQRLQGFRQRNLLTAAAARRLERAIDAAKSGEWEAAARQLYIFMQGQRRDAPSPATNATAMR